MLFLNAYKRTYVNIYFLNVMYALPAYVFMYYAHLSHTYIISIR